MCRRAGGPDPSQTRSTLSAAPKFARGTPPGFGPARVARGAVGQRGVLYFKPSRADGCSRPSRRSVNRTAEPREVQSADPHALDVHELADAEIRELAPVTGALDSAEGKTRVGLHEVVDENRPGFDARSESGPPVAVARPDRCAEAEARIVGDADRIALVLDAHDRSDGAERLLVEGGHSRRDRRENRRRVERSRPGGDLAAGYKTRAARDGYADLPMQVVA